MSMKEAVSSVFSQYAGFTGRARRSEYWYYALFTVILNVVIAIIGAIFQVATGSNIIGSILSLICDLAILIPSIAVCIRRMHDIGKSGWWILISLIPLVGAILVLIWECTDSQPGANQYGPNPKGN